MRSFAGLLWSVVAGVGAADLVASWSPETAWIVGILTTMTGALLVLWLRTAHEVMTKIADRLSAVESRLAALEDRHRGGRS